jgi:hypothetical protein
MCLSLCVSLYVSLCCLYFCFSISLCVSPHLDVAVYLNSQLLFPYTNFVRGFHQPGWTNWFARNNPFSGWWGSANLQNQPKWMPPVAGEKMGLVTYQAYVKRLKKHLCNYFRHIQ